MIEIKGNLFAPPPGTVAVGITTNGSTRKDGAAIMGRGVALQAKTFWPGVEFLLGSRLRYYGNRVHVLTKVDPDHPTWTVLDWPLAGPRFAIGHHLFSFPVKHIYNHAADLGLIEASARELIARFAGKGPIALPRPGCGAGQLTWEVVRPVIAPILAGDQWLIMHP